MLSTEELKNLICKKYGTLANFGKKVGIPRTTLHYITQHGVGATSILNAYKICMALDISFEELTGYKFRNLTEKEREALIEAQKLYRLYLAAPDVQPVVNKLIGYEPKTKPSKSEEGEGADRKSVV